MSAFSKSLQSTLIFITHNNLSSIANTATSLYTLFSPIVGDDLQSCPEPFLPSSQLQWQTHTCTGRTCFVCEKRFSTTSTDLPDVSTLGVLCQIKYLCIIYLVFIWWYFWTNKKKKILSYGLQVSFRHSIWNLWVKCIPPKGGAQFKQDDITVLHNVRYLTLAWGLNQDGSFY